MDAWDAGSEHETSILPDQMLSDDTCLPAAEPVSDTGDWYVEDGEPLVDSVGFASAAVESEGNSESEGSIQQESPATGKEENELPDAAVDPEPVADTGDLYVENGEPLVDSVGFASAAVESEGNSESEGSIQQESPATGEGGNELPDAAVDSEPVADTGDLYVENGEPLVDSVGFTSAAVESEGNNESEGSIQQESPATGKGENELPDAAVDLELSDENSEDRFEATDSEDDIWDILPEPETKSTIEIIVNNFAESSGALIIAPIEGWMEGTNTFAVSCSVPCVVLVSYDSGMTYMRLLSQTVAGGYSFTVDNLARDAILTVLVLGDSNGDGCFTNADITKICSVYSDKASLDMLQRFACDVNGDGKFTNADVTMVRAAYANMDLLD